MKHNGSVVKYMTDSFQVADRARQKDDVIDHRDSWITRTHGSPHSSVCDIVGPVPYLVPPELDVDVVLSVT